MWTTAADSFEDIRYETSGDGIAKITIDRPEVRNAFRPQTVVEVSQALELAREDAGVGVIILTGEGELAFCSRGGPRGGARARLLLRRRPARARRDRLRARGCESRPLPRHGPARADAPAAEA